jgi:hypothetical protein
MAPPAFLLQELRGNVTTSRKVRQKLEELFPGDPERRTFAEVIAAKLVAQAASGGNSLG